jgi:hypothetical protein
MAGVDKELSDVKAALSEALDAVYDVKDRLKKAFEKLHRLETAADFNRKLADVPKLGESHGTR